MKKLFLITVGLITLFSYTGCSPSGNGELVGVQNRKKWRETQPYGMVYVRRGSFNIGPSDQDPAMAGVPTKTVSQDAFWMDDTEITNNEYRQYVHWVRDSTARRLLGEQYPEFLITETRQGVPLDPPRVNWREKIKWNDPDHLMAMEDLFVPENERFFGKNELDARKLIYEYWWIDLQQAARRSNSYNFKTQRYEGNVYDINGELRPIENRSSFIMSDQVYVYPDTLAWIRDFTYSYNEPWATRYFWHPGFDEYPVVGVTWKQALAFCNWRTKIQTDYLTTKRQPGLQAYRLPTEVEWEYAARGGKDFSMYPWGGYYARDKKGVFLANFKPLRGNYAEDGGIITMKVGSFEPNEYGLYDMAGNVAEWTETAYDEAGYSYFSDLNPTFTYNARPDDPPVMKRKVIRGGSWKDVAYYTQVSTRSFEYQDSTKSYIGFRCVRSTFGDEFK
ncbi:MAG: SUMF1/EgtB/PvdO family nonheme iron enzyme [Bacteroidales bacterium]|jgi:sulfatase modifying factor 1|nr:SUMF1/EgtB/PvdO family nonheme iron enzyme [Mariniphaga sp.]NLB93260.1 SUMF1/EgtB/PvdO family nonheme iron enzyme [Bacteroidales bacterium]